MKKILVLSLFVLFTFGLAACDLGGDDIDDDDIDDIICDADETLVDGECVPDEDDTPADTTAPTFDGVDDVEIFIDSTFDPMEGVTATDETDGDVTANITTTGTVDTSSTGTYFIKYSVEDAAGNSREATRYITVVVDPSLIGDEMVPNGDFSLGWAVWTTTTGLEGGTANYSVVNEELVVEITGVAGAMWEPRLENKGITFEEGKFYEITFDARALAPRAIHVQIGEILDGAPWFDNFHETKLEVFDLTTDMETYTFVFAMTNPTNDNGALIFEMGTVEGTVGTDNLLTTVYLDNVAISEVDPSSVEDTEAPIINGINNKVVEQDGDFNPLEGVTVIDNIDGEITLTESNVTGTVDTSTLGEYILTYTVSDAAGNETVETRTITVVEASDARVAYGWRAFLNDWEGTSGDLMVKDGKLVLDITNISALTDNWKVQIIQDATAMGSDVDNDGSMQFEAGKTYKVTFDAKASVAGDINLAIGHAGGGWTEYHAELVSVTTDMATYSVEFTLDNAEMDYTTLAQLKFEMGLLFADQDAPQSFSLDNVVIEVKDDTDAFVDTGLVENGTFTKFVDPLPAIGWRSFVNFWEGTSGEMLVNHQGQLVLELLSMNALTDNWKVQIIQDAYALGTGEDNVGSLTLVAGETYQVTFDAKASVAGDATLAIGHAGGGWTEYFAQAFTVTTSMDTYTFVFTLDNAEVDYTVPAQFKIEMALLFAGLDAPQTFTLDNVTFEVKNETDDFVDAGVIVNGDMGEVIEPAPAVGWRAFLNNWEGTTGDLLVKNGVLSLDLYSLNVYEGWHVQIIQDAFALGTGEDNVGSLTLVAGETYRVTFDAQSSVAGDAKLAIGHAGGGWTGYFEEVFAVTTDMANYSFEFTLDDTEMDYTTEAQFKLELGSLFMGLDAPQNFMVDNVTFEILDDTDTFVDAEVIVNGDMSEVVADEEPTIDQLTTPFGVEINGTTLAWGAMPEAAGFEVHIEGVVDSPFVIAAGIYALDLSTLTLDPGTYNIQVQAIGDDTAYLDSDLSAVITYTVE